MLADIPSHEQKALDFLKYWIEQHTGIVYKNHAKAILYSRLGQLCRELNLQDLNELQHLLNNGQMPNLSLKIAQSVSTNHTHFFREPEILEYFAEQIVPELVTNENIRIWSAASSSGEEAFTIAMYLAEKLGLATASQRIQILGTDINIHVIRQAENGIYSEDSLNQVPLYFRMKYFKPLGLGQYQVIHQLRQMCTFRRMNLHSEQWPFQKHFHTVFCRNVLYYFKTNQQEVVLNHIHRYTDARGHLLTSLTESLYQLDTPWRMIKPGVYQK